MKWNEIKEISINYKHLILNTYLIKVPYIYKWMKNKMEQKFQVPIQSKNTYWDKKKVEKKRNEMSSDACVLMVNQFHWKKNKFDYYTIYNESK